MAFGVGGITQYTQNKVSSLGATSDSIDGANANVGDIHIVVAAFDNVTTTDGEVTELTCSDSKGNTYNRIAEFVNGDTAAAGIHVAAFWSKITTQLLGATDHITVTRAATNVAAKAISGFTYTVASGNTIVVETYIVRADDAAGDLASFTRGSLDNIEHLFLLIGAVESAGAGTGYTAPNYTGDVAIATSGGTDNTNARINLSRRILTATTDTCNPGGSGSRDWAHIYAVLREDGPPVTVSPTGFSAALTLGTPVKAITDLPDGFAAALSQGTPGIQAGTSKTIVATGFALTASRGTPSLTIVQTGTGSAGGGPGLGIGFGLGL